MREINGVEKSMTVWSGNNSYQWVSDKDVKILIRDSMIKNWLAIFPAEINAKIQIDRWEEDDTYNKNPPYPKKSKQSVFTEVTTRYIILHTSGESLELAGYGQGVDAQDKWAGKATTYALKNTLLNMFLIPTGVDTDNTHSDDIPVPQKSIDTPNGWKKEYPVTKWLNFRDLENLVNSWIDTEALLSNHIKDNEFTLSNNMKKTLRAYCDSGELSEIRS